MPKASLSDKITVAKPLVPGQFVRCLFVAVTWLGSLILTYLLSQKILKTKHYKQK